MFQCTRTNSENNDFIALVKYLDADLAEKDGKDHSFYAQFNKIDKIKYVIVAFENDQAVGCGAIKEFDKDSMEVKRMFVLPEYRGRGIAKKILAELETWAKAMSYQKTILETGKRQQEALQLYQKFGYKIIPNYGQYIGIENSVCFEKML
jgi:GNAT superfamily N-acetyltransferase